MSPACPTTAVLPVVPLVIGLALIHHMNEDATVVQYNSASTESVNSVPVPGSYTRPTIILYGISAFLPDQQGTETGSILTRPQHNRKE